MSDYDDALFVALFWNEGSDPALLLMFESSISPSQKTNSRMNDDYVFLSDTVTALHSATRQNQNGNPYIRPYGSTAKVHLVPLGP